MDSGASILKVSIAILCVLVLASTLFPVCDARSHGKALESHRIRRSSSIKSWKKLKSLNRLNKYSSLGHSSFDSYGSPSSLPLPPFNSLAPQPTPTAPSPDSPYPQFTPPTSPSSGGSGNPSLPAYSPVPNPSNNIVSPPPPSGSSQPKHAPNPPKSVPIPSPPQAYLPPIVYPPPPSSSPSPHHKKPQYAVWCVAKPTVPDPIIKEAMDYACGSGADCKSIQPNGSCYFPNTMLAHASYAFNSYWQNTRIGGGTCDFGGTAMLVTVDPSYSKCKFWLT